MKNLRLLLSILLVIVCVAGCKRQMRPDGLPELVPAAMILVQEGTPLADAAVNLFTDSHAFNVYGISDETGKVVLTTYNDDYKGAPVGQYKVTVIKVEKTPSEFGDECPANVAEGGEWMAKRKAEYRPSYDLVNPAFKTIATTTLTLTVNEDGSTDPPNLELGPATREMFIPPDSAPRPGMTPEPVEKD